MSRVLFRVRQIIGLLLVALLVWGSCASMTVAADGLPPSLEQPSPGPTGLGADAISPEKINQFVQAYLTVVALIEQRQATLQAVESESESLRIQQETRAEALQAIEAAGLTLQEYLQLLGLANLDPEFSERIAAQLQEANH